MQLTRDEPIEDEDVGVHGGEETEHEGHRHPEPVVVGGGEAEIVGGSSHRSKGSSRSLSSDRRVIIMSGQCSGTDDVEVGQIFFAKKDLSMKMSVLAMKRNFEFRVNKSTKDLLTVRCLDETCKWRLRAVKLKGCDMFKVSKYVNTHTCSFELLNHDHRQARSWVVGNLIQSKFNDVSLSYRPKDIIQDIRQEYGVNLSYEKAWRAREEALVFARGCPEESYGMLRAYGETLKICNPGTMYEVELEDGKYFKYVFMAVGASIRGFLNYIRPVVVVDGTFLKGKYKGVLLTAASVDGNNQIYPLAFGIVDRESDASWTWFMARLEQSVGVPDGLVVVSDRNTSIGKAVQSVFPNVFHALCIHHLSMNLQAKFKNEEIEPLFFMAAKAFRESEFRALWGCIGAYEGVAKYLEEVGVERWARAYQCGLRYDQMTTNIAECMNAILKDARELPVTALLDHIRGILQRWFHERRTCASSCTTPLSEYAEKYLGEAEEKSRRHTVNSVDCYKFQVIDGHLDGFVDLNTRTCSCREFDYYRIPCSHAIAAARERNVSPYTLCDNTYRIDSLMAAYAEPIIPVGHVSEWKKSTDYVEIEVLPPKRVARVGRRQIIRIPSIGEARQTHKCSRCGNMGHNRKTCRQPLNPA